MKISKVGINLIKQFEGCYLKAYRCPAGVLTIGYGCTVNVKEGQKITQEQADNMLMKELERFEIAIDKLGVKLNQNQFDALVSFSYNLGSGIFKGSLLQAIKQQNWDNVAKQMAMYNKARVNGVLTELKGLTRRRNAEVELFLKQEEIQPIQLETHTTTINLFGDIAKVQTINKDNSNYVKLRDIQCDNIKVGYANGNVTVNGIRINLDDTNSINIDGSNYVKLRSVLEELGFVVGYDNVNKIISVR